MKRGKKEEIEWVFFPLPFTLPDEVGALNPWGKEKKKGLRLFQIAYSLPFSFPPLL
jgi:hypothetical protein